MAIKYQWYAVGDSSCYACERWHGKLFDRLEDVPNLPMHPHCKCYIKAFDTNKAKFEEAVSNLKAYHKQAGHDVGAVQEHLKTAPSGTLQQNIQELLEETRQVFGALGILLKNYADMRNADTIGADTYFHIKANAEAAQLGKTAEEVARFIAASREVFDYYKNIYVKRLTLEEAIKDMKKDWAENAEGRRLGRENPNIKLDSLLEVYKPKILKQKR